MSYTTYDGTFVDYDDPDILDCDECGKTIPGEKAVDHGYRIGDTEEVVERWVCPECDEAIHDEAMGMLP